MNARILTSKLVNGGFNRIKTGVPGIDVYVKKIRDKTYVIELLDFGRKDMADIERVVALENNLAVIYDTSEILAVAFAYDSYGARQRLSEVKNYWIYNEQSCMLEIYDDQPGEFLNIRELIERPEATVANRVFSCTNMLIAANVIVFVIMETLGDTENALFLYRHGGITAHSLLEEHEVYRLFTSIFLHSGIRHIFSNMLVLFFVGNDLEQIIGRVKYMLLYFGSGLAGGIVSQLYYSRSPDDLYTVCVGASGAIFGVMGAMIWVLARNKGRVGNKILSRYIIGVVLSIFMGFTAAGISQSAHIGGLIGGLVLAALLYRKRGLAE